MRPKVNARRESQAGNVNEEEQRAESTLDRPTATTLSTIIHLPHPPSPPTSLSSSSPSPKSLRKFNDLAAPRSPWTLVLRADAGTSLDTVGNLTRRDSSLPHHLDPAASSPNLLIPLPLLLQLLLNTFLQPYETKRDPSWAGPADWLRLITHFKPMASFEMC